MAEPMLHLHASAAVGARSLRAQVPA